MSDSSSSSDSDSKRRKKSFHDEPRKGKPSHQRNTLPLNKSNLEKLDQSFKENLITSEDEDAHSCTIVTISSNEQTESNLQNSPDYTSLATQFGISVLTAKKYYSVFIRKCDVRILKTKIEAISPPTSAESSKVTSPVLGLKKKSQQSQRSGKCRSKRINQNVQNYFKTLNKVEVKDEPQSCTSHTEEFSDKYPDSISSNTLKTNLVKKWENLIDESSGDEFEDFSFRNIYNNPSKSQNVNSPALVTNPYSKIENKPIKCSSKNSNLPQLPEKKQSIWTEVGNDDPIKKKKKIIQIFEKKSEESEDDVVFMGDISPVKNRKEYLKRSNKASRRLNLESKRKKREKKSNSKSISSSNTSTNNKLNSLSVNCQPFYNVAKARLQNATKLSSNNKVLSFGAGLSDVEQNDNDNIVVDSNKDKTENKNKNLIVSKNDNNNIITHDDTSTTDDLNVNKITNKNKNLIVSESDDNNFAANPSQNDDKDFIASPSENDTQSSQRECTESNEKRSTQSGSCTSLDLFDSPEKLNFEITPKRKSMPNFNSEPETDTSGNCQNESSTNDELKTKEKKSKVKPIIVSDDKLPTNTIIIPNFQKIRRKLQLRNNTQLHVESSESTDSSCPRPLSSQSINVSKKVSSDTNNVGLNQMELNGTAKSVINTQNENITPEDKLFTNKLTNSKSNIPRLETNQLKIPESSSDNIEETFDSLCQDVCKLSSHENITLYKGDQSEDPDSRSKRIGLSEPTKQLTDTGLKMRNTLGNNSNETFSRVENSLKQSPVLQRTIRSRLSLKSPIARKIQNDSSPLNIRNRLQHQQIQQSLELGSLRHQNPLSSPYTMNQKTRFKRDISPIKFIDTSEENSRLNRPISPVKSLGISERDPRINKAISPPITSNASERDPRLNRTISPVYYPDASNRDPRLNRSFSPNKPNVVTDPRLQRGKSQPRQLEDSQQSLATNIDQIVDPRLRKRKEREEAERATKITKIDDVVEETDKNLDLSISPSTPSTKRRPSSVFQRLGSKSKTPSPDRGSRDGSNDFLNIVKLKTTIYDSDDDHLSIHPGELFSDDEEEEFNSSPPHRKFISERLNDRQNMPQQQQQQQQQQQRQQHHQQILNQGTSVKNRLKLNVNSVNRRLPPPQPISIEPPAITPLSRITLNTNSHPQRRPQVPLQPSVQTSIPKLMSVPVNLASNVLLNAYGNDDVVFDDKFYKMNAAQMLKDEDNFSNQEVESETYITFGTGKAEQATKFDHVSMLNGPSEPAQIGLSNDVNKTSFFRNYCYKAMRKGKCMNELNCNFSHHVEFLQKVIKQKTRIELLYPILDFAINNQFEFFLTNIWSIILPVLQNDAFKVFEKLYKINIRSEKVIRELLNFCIDSKLYSVESFIKKISLIIEKGDKETICIICAAVKGKLSEGFCWEMIREMCQKAPPPTDIIEMTIIQCLRRKKNLNHIKEVNDLVYNKIGNIERNKMSQSMLKQFDSLVQSKGVTLNREMLNTTPLANISNNVNTLASRISVRSNSTESTRSLENEKPTGRIVKSLSTATLKNRRRLSHQETIPVEVTDTLLQQPNNSPLEEVRIIANKGESMNVEYTVQEIDADEPSSLFRDRFWKLYVSVHNIKEGLKHVDYEYVWKILDEFSKEDIHDELLKRAYYHILCKNVRSCEQHVTQIIKQAVRRCGSSTSRKSIDTLFDIGVCALIDLADSDLWVMALQLLNWVKILEPDEPRTIFTLVSAEIHLANNDPLEALYLLQRTRLLRTNRDEWLTKDHTKDAEKHRNKVVFILLQSLSYHDQEKAVYLFKVLMTDQYISYYPIDLPLYLDKLTLLLLLYNKEELVADVCRLVMDNDLTFQRETYSEIISQLLPYDEILTNQILEYAIHLGYIHDVQIRGGFTTVIIDMNCYEEQLYLIFKRLIHKLVLNIGPSIQHLKPNNLKVILVFEDLPTETRLCKNEIAVSCKEKYKSFRNLVNKMLATRFTPPIRISRAKPSKFCKLISRSLVDHLKHWN